MSYNEETDKKEHHDNNICNESEIVTKDVHARMIAEYVETIAVLQDKYARLFADVENMKRRALDEQKLDKERVEKKIFLDVLPIIDNFERSMQTNEQQKNSGIALIYALFQKFLKQHDIREIEATGLFDPELHEAISQISDDQKQSGTIVQIFEKGYYLHNKILRHAKVSVVA